MALNHVIDVFSAIVTVALVAVLVGSKNTASIIKAWGNAFSSSLSAAMGGK